MCISVFLCVPGRLWWSSVQPRQHAHVPGRGGQLGGRLRSQKQTGHLRDGHQIPRLDRRNYGGVIHCDTVKDEDVNPDRRRVPSDGLSLSLNTTQTDRPADAVASSPSCSCSGECTDFLEQQLLRIIDLL